MAEAQREVGFGIREMERPIEFTSDGKKLKGIVHIPPGDRKRKGVVFLNAGLKYRVGPHRIYVKIARRLSQEGVPSLRFDLPGLGDSEGEIVDPHYDCFETSPASDAVDFFVKEAGVEEVTLLGMCAGSRTALRTAAKDFRIDSLILISFPIAFVHANSPTARHSSKATGGKVRLTAAQNRYYLSYYLERCADLGAWLKFVTLRVAYRELGNVIWGSIYTRLRKRQDENTGCREILNSWRSLLSSGRRVLLVYGEHDDPLIRDFKENIEGGVRHRDKGRRPPYELLIVRGASHTFSELDAQGSLIEEIINWVTKGRMGSASSKKVTGDKVSSANLTPRPGNTAIVHRRM